jgi:hypothetical protein
VGALVQHHLKDGAAAGGEQLAGHEQFGHPALTGAVGHPPLGPVVATQPAAPGPVTRTVPGTDELLREIGIQHDRAQATPGRGLAHVERQCGLAGRRRPVDDDCAPPLAAPPREVAIPVHDAPGG